MVLEYINKYKEEIKGCIEDLKHKETFYRQVPNLLTFSRSIGSIPIGIMFLNGNVIMGIIFTGLLLSTDYFDGKIARKWNIQSKFGADLDAFCDKIMFLGLSLALIVNNPVILFNFMLEGMISLVNVVGRINGLDTRTVFSGKVKTCLLSLTLIYGYMVQFFNMPVSVLNVLVSMTLGGQCVALGSYVREYHRLSKEKNDKKEIDLQFDQIEKEEIEVLEKENDLLEELRYEKELLLGMSEPDKVRSNVRSRKIENEKKNGNFGSIKSSVK